MFYCQSCQLQHQHSRSAERLESICLNSSPSLLGLITQQGPKKSIGIHFSCGQNDLQASGLDFDAHLWRLFADFLFFLFILSLDLNQSFAEKRCFHNSEMFCFAASARRGHDQRCLLKCSPDTLMDFGNKLQTGCSLADGGVPPRKTLYFICIKGSHSARSCPEIETFFFNTPAAPSYSKQIHHFLCFCLAQLPKSLD